MFQIFWKNTECGDKPCIRCNFVDTVWLLHMVYQNIEALEASLPNELDAESVPNEVLYF